MTHYMRLHDKPYKLIKQGKKTIELRLNDEKRQLIKLGDIIEFENRTTGEKIKTVVINLYRYKNFYDLYKNFNKISLGYKENEEADYRDMEKYYSVHEQQIYGVVGIEISLLDEDKRNESTNN